MSVYEASIDDNDSQIVYSDGWELVTEDGDWRGTMHSTSVIGSFARVRFTGSRVAVVCTIPTGDGLPSQASFALDNGPAVKMSHATTPPVQWQTVFWDSGPLTFGSHLVVITNTGNTAYFRLDHIDYDPTSASSPSSSVRSGTTTVRSTLTSTVVIGTSASSDGGTAALGPSGSSASGSQPSQSVSVSIQTVVGGSGTSSLTSSTGISSSGTNLDDATSTAAGASSSTKSSTPTAGIIAGVLGGLLGILLLVLALLYLRRRRRRAIAVQLNDPDSLDIPRRSGTTIPTPFGVSHEMSSSNLQSNPSIISPYGLDSRGTLSSPITSTSMYVSGSESSTMIAGHNGQHQYQHLGAGAAGGGGTGTWGNTIGAGGGPRSKHAEFIAEQQNQLVDTSIVPVPTADYAEGGSSSVSGFQDAPPAYPGKV